VDGHGGMRLAGRAADVLRGALTVELRRDPLPPPRGRSGSGRKGRDAAAELADDGDRALFEVLRAKRMQLAKAEGLAAYMVFADRTLIEMAQRRPATARELETVHGVGAAKLTRWGEEFLAVIRAAGEGESAGA